MELQREQPPEYVSHNPDDLKLPSVPQQAVQISHSPASVTLPHLDSILAGLPSHDPSATRAPETRAQQFTHSSGRKASNVSHGSFRAYSQAQQSASLNGTLQSNLDSAVVSPSDTASVMSFEEHGRRSTSVVSLEDPDVRLAAEALSGLGNPDFLRSPSKATSVNSSQTSSNQLRSGQHANQEPEPILQLLVDAHPWVGGTINGSLSAYTTTKNYSPRFVQYGANLLERNIGSPMASTVSSVGRRTGVEDGIRRYLDSRRPSDLERADSDGGRGKRRMVANEDAMDIDEEGANTAMEDTSPRRESQEYLPAYRGSKPPSYREAESPSSSDRRQLATRPPHSRSWSTQLMISTSGLGVALSESSLRSLTYCVGLLTKATEHVETVMNALKMVLKEYDQAQEARQQEDARRAKAIEAGVIGRAQADKDEAAQRLAERIKQLCDDIWNTMKTVVNSVSTYAGGALPDNARRLVKGQLMSIPQRWRVATQTAAQQNQQHVEASEGGESSRAGTETEARKAAHRMIAFADEGLDMMAQVNGVVKITLQSAEEWLRSLGRRNRARDEEMMDTDEPRQGQGQLS